MPARATPSRPVIPAEPVPDPAERARRLCAVLTRLVDAEPLGFADLRGGPVDARTWEGSLVPPGMRDCRIEGSGHPVASYVCRGFPMAGDPVAGDGDAAAGLLLPAYRDTAAAVESCLGQAAWYPRDWRRGDEFLFGAGERQIVWQDLAARPRSSVALKIEEDIGLRAYYVRLAVGSIP